MWNKLLSSLTILIAIGAIFLGFKTKEMVTALQASFQKEHNELMATQSKLKTTEKKLAETEEKLAATEKDLSDTKTKLASKEKELADTTAKLATTEASLEEKEKAIKDLNEQIDVLTGSGGGGIADFKKKVEEMMTKSKALEDENKKLGEELAESKTMVEGLTVEKKKLEGTVASQDVKLGKYEQNIMQKGLRGRVMAVNAGWAFVVLDIGDKKGAAMNRELVVVRSGQAIGKVRIASVEAHQSIADILPRSMLKGMTIEPGDSVIYTGDDKPQVEAPAEAAAPVLPVR